MTRPRFLAIAFALELFALLSLTQTWLTISMAPNGSVVSLGTFDGATTYPASMPLSLFTIAATLMALLTTRVSRILALGAALLATLLNLVTTCLLLASKNVSALDSQLDRLTGIANTHGISDLSIENTIWSLVWAVSSSALAAVLIGSLIWQKNWVKAVASERSASRASKKPRVSESPIDLWDSQRG